MKVSVLTVWYNEQDMAPFFLDNYSWADEIIILLDDASTDMSREVALARPNVRIERCATPGGLIDDGYLVDLKSDWAHKIDADWIISVDADELIIPPDDDDHRRVLTGCNGNLIYLHLWQVWRNEMNVDLDPDATAIWQRRYGDLNRTEGENGSYRKPVIFKPETNIVWYPGQHRYHRNPQIKPSCCVFDGAHWSMADEGMAIRRRIAGRKKRLSANNYANRWGYQWFDITAKQIRAECAKHLYDPRLF